MIYKWKKIVLKKDKFILMNLNDVKELSFAEPIMF